MIYILNQSQYSHDKQQSHSTLQCFRHKCDKENTIKLKFHFAVCCQVLAIISGCRHTYCLTLGYHGVTDALWWQMWWSRNVLRQSYCLRQNNLLTDDKRVPKCILSVVFNANHPKMDAKMRNLQDRDATHYIFTYTNEYMKKQLRKTSCPFRINSQVKSDLTDSSIYIQDSF